MATPLVFGPGPAQTAFIVAAGAWAVFEVVMRLRQATQSRGPVSRDLTYFVLMPCLAASIVVSELLGRRGGLLWPGGLVWPVVAGLTLVVAGIALRVWSIATLGRFFQYRIKVQPGHRIVATGPYRYLRHPSYTGIGLVMVGIALACDDVWALPAVVVLTAIGLVVRIRAEEQQLDQALGAGYEQFAAHRKRLIPGVW